MKRMILRALNTPALVLIATIAIALQTSLFNTQWLHYLQPDIVLIFVVWCALQRSFLEGGILTLIFANLAELHSATPQGFMLLTYMVLFLMIRLAVRYIIIPTHFGLIVFTFIASIIWKLLSFEMLYLLDIPSIQWRYTLLLTVPEAFIVSFLSHWAFRWLERFDILTFKSKLAEKDDDEQLHDETMEGI